MKPPSKASVYRRFRLVAAAAVSAMAFAVPAVAADMPLKVPDVVVPPPLWTGFYIGVHGGWGWNRTQIHDLLLSTPPNSIFQTSTDGPIGGGQIGVNWQYYNLAHPRRPHVCMVRPLTSRSRNRCSAFERSRT
jgi:opacity protein-like surface antigen